MNAIAHTPGPWEVKYYSGDNNRPTVVRKLLNRVDDPICAIAKFFTHHGTDETEANALLVSAAPNLLEACKAAKDCIRNDVIFSKQNDLPDQPLLGKLNLIHEQLVDVIAKAEGKQK